MNEAETPLKRILAIDPTSKGFGYIVLEDSDFLVDWGIKEARDNKNTRCLKQIRYLIELYQPHVVAVEDCSKHGTRRSERVRDLVAGIIKLAEEQGIRSRQVLRQKVRQAFESFGATTKHEIAQAIARRFPEIADRLPPKRRPYMSEDARMAIFGAAAIALTVLTTV